MAAIGARHMDETPLERLRRFGKLGTIDLRIDYLRPPSAIASCCAPRCFASARASRRRGWSSPTPTASCSRPGARSTSCLGPARARRLAVSRRDRRAPRLGAVTTSAPFARRERVELAPIRRRRHVDQAENAVIEVVVASAERRATGRGTRGRCRVAPRARRRPRR
jgi:hypothetical protein